MILSLSYSPMSVKTSTFHAALLPVGLQRKLRLDLLRLAVIIGALKSPLFVVVLGLASLTVYHFLSFNC
jgi:hypothetical protein